MFSHLWFLNFTKIYRDVVFSLLSCLGLYNSFQSGVFHLLFLFLQISPPLFLFFLLSWNSFIWTLVLPCAYDLSSSYFKNFSPCIFSAAFQENSSMWASNSHILSWGLSIQLFSSSIYFNHYSYTIFLLVYFLWLLPTSSFDSVSFVQNIYYAHFKILVNLSQLSCFMGWVMLNLLSS